MSYIVERADGWHVVARDANGVLVRRVATHMDWEAARLLRDARNQGSQLC